MERAVLRRITIGILAVTAPVLAGCGGSSKFANRPRPATPVDLTVYINNARVSVSPASIGAGPMIFIVTNQSANAQTLTVLTAGAAGNQLADTGPIQPQATAQVTVDLDQPGDYVITTAPNGQTDASVTGPATIRPATLHVGAPRPNSNNQLLQP